jgi:hypothetical protein
LVEDGGETREVSGSNGIGDLAPLSSGRSLSGRGLVKLPAGGVAGGDFRSFQRPDE